LVVLQGCCVVARGAIVEALAAERGGVKVWSDRQNPRSGDCVEGLEAVDDVY